MSTVKLPLPDIHLSNFGWKYTLSKPERITALRKAIMAFGIKKVYKSLVLLRNIQSHDRKKVRHIMEEDISYLKKIFDKLNPLMKEKMRGGADDDSEENIILEGTEELEKIEVKNGVLQNIIIEKIEYSFKKITEEEFSKIVENSSSCFVQNKNIYRENNNYIGLFAGDDCLGVSRLINRIDYTEIDALCCDMNYKKLMIKFLIRFIQNTTKSEKVIIMVRSDSEIIKDLLNFWYDSGFHIGHVENGFYIFEKQI